MKFGGTSVKDDSRMLNVLEIVKEQKEKKIVVLSACGGITDQLIVAANHSKQKNINEATTIANQIITHHLEIANKFNNTSIKNDAIQAINKYSAELLNLLEGIFLLQELTPAAMDSVFAFGELLSSAVFHFLCLDNKINNQWFDARNLLKTDSNFNNANPLAEEYENKLIEIFNNEFNCDLAITQGFIASDLNSRTTTLGRGGSDLTASLIGSAINAKQIQIWTDVDGVFTADPNKIKNAKIIEKMTYSEVKDLSFWGAKVLHPKTILPAIEKNIPLVVLNSFNPKSTGTTIIAQSQSNEMKIHSVVAKKNCILQKITINNSETNNSQIVNSSKVVNNSKVNNNDLSLLLNSNGLLNFSELLYADYSNGNADLLFNAASDNVVTAVDSKSATSKVNNVIVVCITGENFDLNPILLTETISDIVKCFENVKLHKLICNYSAHSLLFVIDECDVDVIIEKIHSSQMAATN